MQTTPKNTARIEEIRANMDARVTLKLVTPFFKRLVNREFHIVTAKLFIQLKLDLKKMECSPEKPMRQLKILRLKRTA